MTDAPRRTKKPFTFSTQLHLQELTGLRASTLRQLVQIMGRVPGSVIYYHTHRFLKQHQYLSPEPPNDFAYWVTSVLGEMRLGEMLASIDTVQFSTIRALREKLLSTVESYMRQHPSSVLRFADAGQEFHFMKAVSFVMPMGVQASTLQEFAEALQRVTISCIYFHIFDSRLRLGKPANDFSHWLDTSLGEVELAEALSSLDPYTYTLEGLRQHMLELIGRRLRHQQGGG